SGSADYDRIKFAFRVCFSRPPTASEHTIVSKYLQQSRDRFDDDTQAWTAVARLLMNLDEFITRE
ncbi:MAG: hypothetical protein N2C14_30745, partial [Planctomycetales bacterium]